MSRPLHTRQYTSADASNSDQHGAVGRQALGHRRIRARQDVIAAGLGASFLTRLPLLPMASVRHGSQREAFLT